MPPELGLHQRLHHCQRVSGIERQAGCSTILRLRSPQENGEEQSQARGEGLKPVESSPLAVIDKLKSLPAGMAESFANSFAKGADSLLAQQEKKLASRQELPLELPIPLVEQTPLLYRTNEKPLQKRQLRRKWTEEKKRDCARQLG
jgi:hypothetical protein